MFLLITNYDGEVLQGKVLKDSLSIHSLLGKESSSGKHCKTTILKLLRDHRVQLLGILGLQAKRIKSDISRVVIVAQKSWLIVRRIGGIHPSNLSTLGLGRSNERDDQRIPAVRHLKEVGDGRSRDLRIEEERAALDGLSDQESDDGKHRNTAVSDLGLAVSLQGLLVGLGGKAKRIEESHGSEGAGHVVDGEGVHGGGGLGHGGGSEGSDGAGEEGGESDLHHDVGSWVRGGVDLLQGVKL